MSQMPAIGDDEPITLKEACAGKYAVHFLAREGNGGRLKTFKIDRRIFTTPAFMKAFEAALRPDTWHATDRSGAGIYVIGFGSYLKIGWSDCINERLADIQLRLPEIIKLYGIIKAEPRVEFIAHRRFAAYRLRGEWFRNEGEVGAWAEAWAEMQSPGRVSR